MDAAKMVLLLIGTNPYPFRRLVDRVDQWRRQENVHVIGQTGHTPVDNVSFECHPFVDHDQIIKWILEAQFIICQGGFGSLMDCLALNKPVLAVPRLPENGECVDSQTEVVKALEEEGRIVALYDIDQFDDAIELIRQFKPPTSIGSRIPDLVAGIISDYIGGRSQ